MMRPCVAAHALSTVVLAALLHAQADLHRTSDDGSIKRPVEAPLRMRLFNPRAGDPRRRVGDLLTPEDLELKVSVAQAVQGKNIGATKADYAFVGYMPLTGRGDQLVKAVCISLVLFAVHHVGVLVYQLDLLGRRCGIMIQGIIPGLRFGIMAGTLLGLQNQPETN